MIKYIIIFLFTLSKIAIGQAPVISWQNCFGGSGSQFCNSICSTSDNGYLVGGQTSSNDGDASGNHGDFDLWILKLDSNGLLQWQKCLGGSAQEFSGIVLETKDGKYIACGNTASNDGDVSGNHGLNDVWVVKFDSSGIIWQKCYGGTNEDVPTNIKQTYDGGFILSCFTLSHDGDVTGFHFGIEYDIWIIKLDSLGTLQWQKCLGGTLNDEAYDIIQIQDSGYVVTGVVRSVDGDVVGNHANSYDLWVAKLTNAGILQWQKCLGGSQYDKAYSINETSDTGFIICGTTNSPDGDVFGWNSNHGEDYWIVKTDSLSNIEWSKVFGGTYLDNAYDAIEVANKNYIVSGTVLSSDDDVVGQHPNCFISISDIDVLMFDSMGTMVWQKCLGGYADESGGGIIESISNDGLIVAANAQSIDGDVTCGPGFYGDIWIVKLSPSPNNVQKEANAKTNVNANYNPTNQTISLDFYSDGNNAAKIELFDFTGRLLQKQNLNVVTGLNHNTFEINKISPGIYIVSLEQNELHQIVKILIN